jgi:hypothetical protein
MEPVWLSRNLAKLALVRVGGGAFDERFGMQKKQVKSSQQ